MIVLGPSDGTVYNPFNYMGREKVPFLFQISMSLVMSSCSPSQVLLILWSLC